MEIGGKYSFHSAGGFERVLYQTYISFNCNFLFCRRIFQRRSDVFIETFGERLERKGRERNGPEHDLYSSAGKNIFCGLSGSETVLYFVGCSGDAENFPDNPQNRISRDYYPAVIVNKMLGASSNSLLFDVLRLKRGYTYGAYSSFDCGKYLNEFRATSSVQAAYTPEAMLLFRECIADYGNQFTAQTLDKTRDAMFRENAAAFEMPDARLDILEAIAAYELPAGFMKTQEQMLRDMTPEQAQECIRKWLNYDRMFYVVVGDAETQLDRVKKAGLGEVIVVNKEGVPEK